MVGFTCILGMYRAYCVPWPWISILKQTRWLLLSIEHAERQNRQILDILCISGMTTSDTNLYMSWMAVAKEQTEKIDTGYPTHIRDHGLSYQSLDKLNGYHKANLELIVPVHRSADASQIKQEEWTKQAEQIDQVEQIEQRDQMEQE